MSEHENVPEWASQKARNLTLEETGCTSYQRAWTALARYIAANEEPPVDPLVEEADLIASGEHRWETAADYEGGKAVALAALRRGIEIAGERP